MSAFDALPMQRGYGFRVRVLRFGTRRFGLVKHATILAVTAVGVDGTQSIANRTLSDFVLFGACHDRLFGDSFFKNIGVRSFPPDG